MLIIFFKLVLFLISTISFIGFVAEYDRKREFSFMLFTFSIISMMALAVLFAATMP